MFDRDERPVTGARGEPLGMRGQLPSNLPTVVSSHVTLSGDPAVGVVHHLAWHHDARNGMDREDLVSFGQRNGAILRQIRSLQVCSVFVEGWDVSTTVAQMVSQHDLDRLASYFPARSVPRRLSDYQSLVLSETTFASAVAFFYPRLLIFGADSTNRMLRDLPLRYPSPELREEIVFRFRETLALQAIRESFLSTPPERRNAALVFGAGHVFDHEDLPHDTTEAEMPRVTKHIFADWSIYDDTKRVISATCPLERVLAIRAAKRLLGFVWRLPMSSAEQLLILPKLKAEPDSAESPAQLFSQLLQKLADGPERAEVLSLMKSLYREKGGPFSDVALRPRSGAALARVWGESESAEICKEKHAFTQLEMVKRAFKVEWWAYSSIITRKGQLLSLEKLRVNPGQPAEELLSYLLQTSGAEKVRSEVLRRYEERHAPFTPQL